MYYTTRKDQRDAIRALIADSSFASGPGLREAELEKMLIAALDELDQRDVTAPALLAAEDTEGALGDLRRAKIIMAEKRRIRNARSDEPSERELAHHFRIPAVEVLRLLKLAEKIEADLEPARELKRTSDELEAELGRPVTFEDVMERTGMEWNDVYRLLALAEMDARGEL